MHTAHSQRSERRGILNLMRRPMGIPISAISSGQYQPDAPARGASQRCDQLAADLAGAFWCCAVSPPPGTASHKSAHSIAHGEQVKRPESARQHRSIPGCTVCRITLSRWIATSPRSLDCAALSAGLFCLRRRLRPLQDSKSKRAHDAPCEKPSFGHISLSRLDFRWSTA
jgi:hypothetical protein